jgi:hypothetical protein
MVRHLKVLAISMVFTTVAMGFAYALPSAFRGAASQVSEELDMFDDSKGQTEEEPLDVGFQAKSAKGKGAQGATGAQSSESPKDSKGGTSQDANHGAVVSVAAHCPVTGRAHGEFVREVAQDKEMTVAEAEEACTAAVAAQEDQVKLAKPDKRTRPVPPAKPEKPTKPDRAGGPMSDKPEKPATPAGPKPAESNKPAAPAASSKPDKPKKSH